jgi:RsiW-degrading membrane proteinase PrsW (M82 family)
MSDAQNDEAECCVCHERLTPPYCVLGQRPYCERHYQMVNKPHPGFWRASLIQIAGMGIFSAVVALIANQFQGQLSQPLLIGLGVFIAIVPSLLWIVFFYQQDHLEPEPKTRVAAVFLVAFALADIVGRRIVYEWFDIASWASFDTTTSLLASILILGFTYQALIYTAVRLVVYASDEFDERMDGIVYGTVAGLGLAALLNLRYILVNGGVALGPGVISTATTALAQASFGGLLGYFMAEAKFEHRPAWWIPLAMTVSAVLNGLLSWLIGEVSAQGLGVNPWRSLLMGLLVALIAFVALIALMNRTTPVALRRART